MTVFCLILAKIAIFWIDANTRDVPEFFLHKYNQSKKKFFFKVFGFKFLTNQRIFSIQNRNPFGRKWVDQVKISDKSRIEKKFTCGTN